MKKKQLHKMRFLIPKDLARFLALWVLFASMGLSLFGQQTSFQFNFDYPDVKTNADGYTIVNYKDCYSTADEGNPLLSYLGVEIIIPAGHELRNVRILAKDYYPVTEDVLLEPASRMFPISQKVPDDYKVQMNEAIYSSTEPYPGKICGHLSTQYLNGHSIASFSVCPIEFIPASREARFLKSLSVEIETVQTEKAAQGSLFLQKSDRILDRIQDLVINPEDVALYSYPKSRDNTESDILLITSSALLPAFDEYVNFKTSTGFIVSAVSTESIYSNYTGVDEQEQIRNCIIDYYTNYGISFVILGGDTDPNDPAQNIVPHRGMYIVCGSETETDMPSDMYYCCLDGTWNSDGDDKYGEPGEEDFYAEVGVGRICVDNATEIANNTAKLKKYQNSPVIADIEKALMVGEELNDDPQTNGGDYKDEVADGSSTNGYTTVGVSSNFTVSELYERDQSWSKYDIFSQFNTTGVNLLNHLGHSSPWFNMKLSSSDLTTSNFTNDGVSRGYVIGYSQGCYNGAFDNRDWNPNYGADCIAEEFTNLATGEVACVANSRYGWYNPGGTNSTSQYLDRQFYDAIFSEDITMIGLVNNDCKEEDQSYFNANSYMRWSTYETNLFGDPSMDIWTAQPTDIIATYNQAITLGSAQFMIQTDAPDCRIGLMQNGLLIARALADSQGDATLTFANPINDPAEISISIIAHNRNRHQGTISVISDGPFVMYNSHLIDDAAGNNNGQLDNGESVSITINLKNVGTETAYSVEMSLSTDNSYVTLTDTFAAYGNFSAGDSISVNNGYSLTVAGNVPDQEMVELNCLAHSNTTSDSWQSSFQLCINAPDLEITEYLVNDVASGNGNGLLDPGETAYIEYVVHNNGHADAADVQASLSETSQDVTIIGSASQSLGAISSQDSAIASFEVFVNASAPLGSQAVFTADAASGSYQDAITFNLYIGMEYIEVGGGTELTYYVPVYGFYDYSWSRVVYQQSELQAAATFNKISYQYGNAVSGYIMPNQSIWMKHTTDENITDAAYLDPESNGFTKVFDGEINFTGSIGDWVEIEFNESDFEYNGGDNLIVVWENRDGAWASGYPRWLHSTATDRAVYKYADGSFPTTNGSIQDILPNTRFYLGGSGGGGGSDLPAPQNLMASVLDDDVSLTWSSPFSGGSYDIIYTDDTPENATAWNVVNSENALRMTPAGYPCIINTVSVNIYDGTWPAGNILTPMEILIYAGDGDDGMPGTLLGSKTVTPTHYNWIDIDVSDLGVYITEGDFYVSHKQIGTYPNCPPTAVDEGAGVNRSYSRVYDDVWGVAAYQDFMFKANVTGPDNGDYALGHQQVLVPDAQGKQSISAKQNATLPGVKESGTANYQHALNNRNFLGYNLYRDDDMLNSTVITDTSYTDLALENGTYSYLVTALYSDGESEAEGPAIAIVDHFTLNPPRNLVAATQGNTVNLSWDYPLPMNSGLRIIKEAAREQNINPNVEASPTYRDVEVLTQTRALFDLQFDYAATGGAAAGEAGAECDGTYIYTTKWNGDEYYRYALDGTFLTTFTVAGTSGCRDLAYDGTYFYGAAAATSLYQMDFTPGSETLVSTISAATATRAVAYDDGADGFWGNNWSTDITLYSRTGTTLNSFAVGAYSSYYGFAYDAYSSGGPFLWGFSQDGSGGVLVQYDIATGTETGVSHDVIADVGIAGDLAGGLFTQGGIVGSSVTIGGCVQNVSIFGYELTATEAPQNLIAFNIYRDDTYIAQNDADVLTFSDMFVAVGTHEYAVSAVYGEPTTGESVKCDSVMVIIFEDAQADFTGSPQQIIVGNSVDFTDISTGNPTSWSWSFEGGSPSTSTQQNPTVTYNQAGSYDVSLTVQNAGGQSNTETKVDYIAVVEEPGQHFVPIWSGGALNPMTITVTLATLDAADLIAGDEIGVFDGDLCVGAAVIDAVINPNNASTHVYITCSQNDPGTTEQDGYISGNPITYRLWDQDLLFEAQTVGVVFPYPTFEFSNFVQGETAIVQLNGASSINQQHNLVSGWNLLSWNVCPANMNIQDVLQPIINEGKLVKVIDENGNILQHMPWGWVNNIGDMANTEGYQVKTNSECTLSTDGPAVALPIDIAMLSGWNLMGWPAQSGEDAEIVFADIISSNQLLKVIDENGNILQNMPWGWVNNIGDMEPGKGYQVKTNAACTLTINEPSGGGKTTKPFSPNAVYFQSQTTGNPYNPMTFAIQLNNNLPDGAEIAVFEGERCLGAAVVTGEYIYLAAGMDEAETSEIEGFTEGREFSFRYRTADMNQSESLQISYIEGDKTFAERGTFVGELKEATGNNEYGLNELQLFQNQPNPFHERSQISFDLPQNGNVKLEILSLTGKSLRVLHEGELGAGHYTKTINAANWPAGMYYCRLSFIRGNNVQIKAKRIVIY